MMNENLKYWLECGKHYQEKVDTGNLKALDDLDRCIKHIGMILHLGFIEAEKWLLDNM